MTEEEKAIIKNLKDTFSEDMEEITFSEDGIAEIREALNLIEKLEERIEELQKENEKWKENARIAEENDTTLVLDVNQACKELGISEDTIIADELADKIKEKYILKDKIRELLEIILMF